MELVMYIYSDRLLLQAASFESVKNILRHVAVPPQSGIRESSNEFIRLSFSLVEINSFALYHLVAVLDLHFRQAVDDMYKCDIKGGFGRGGNLGIQTMPEQ